MADHQGGLVDDQEVAVLVQDPAPEIRGIDQRHIRSLGTGGTRRPSARAMADRLRLGWGIWESTESELGSRKSGGARLSSGDDLEFDFAPQHRKLSEKLWIG